MRWLPPLLLVASAHLVLTACTEYGLGDGLRPVEDPIADAAAEETPWWEDPWAEPPEDGWTDPINEGGNESGDEGGTDGGVGHPDDLEGLVIQGDDDDEDGTDGTDGDGVDDEDEGATTPDGTEL